MISKFSMTNISNNLADNKFISWCKTLDAELFNCIDKGFEGERISLKRKERIKDKIKNEMIEKTRLNNEN